MTEPTAIVVPRENVNDESATLVAWTIAPGVRVAPGQPVAQIETSKAVVDLLAPAGGVFHPKVRAGEDVPIGAVLGWILAEGAVCPPDVLVAPSLGANGYVSPATNLDSRAPFSPAVRRIIAEEKIDPAQLRGTGRDGRITKGDLLAHLADARKPARFSPQARELIKDLGLDERSFAGRGLVRVRDIRAAVESPPSPASQSRLVAAAGVITRSERLTRAKRVEAKSLRDGAEMTLPSVVTIACLTRGFRAAVARQAVVGDIATAVIVAETARLLRKYPVLNAYYSDENISYYEDVNIGFAIDSGRGLKVPVIRNADRKEIVTIAAELRELVVTYLDDRLTVESLAGGTFTVTDLSGENVVAFHPLISRGQAAILGICAEVFLPGSEVGAFNLVLGFDHQLSEGRTAGRFLGELRERLAQYEATFLKDHGTRAQEPRCARCQAGYHELAANGHALVQSVQADGSVRLLCKLCFEGWT